MIGSQHPRLDPADPKSRHVKLFHSERIGNGDGIIHELRKRVSVQSRRTRGGRVPALIGRHRPEAILREGMRYRRPGGRLLWKSMK
jgi:hypothetical protein